MHATTSLTVLAALPASLALVLPNGVGRLPALGWNSWNAFYCDVDAAKILTAANEIVSLGLKDAGYEYVNIDDCYSMRDNGRDNVTGKILPDPVKFPDGISGVASQIHALGLKVGIYSSAGTKTCGGFPASLGNEYLDASTFAEWGIDYLKYDNCYVTANWTDKYNACVPDQDAKYGPFPNGTCAVDSTTAPAGYDWSTSLTAQRYRIMRDALLAQNRTILYSLCEWGQADVEEWGNATGSSWRMSGDITPDYPRIAEILNENSFLLNSVNFWGHNDADMLHVGNGNLTMAETRTHFAFWAAMKSPLIIGTALDKLATEKVELLKNKYLLAFNQDKTHGAPATPYKWGVNPNWTFNHTYPAEYWSGASEKGTLVLVLNGLDKNVTKTASWHEIPNLGAHAYYVTDVWTGQHLGCIEGGIRRTLESHDTAAYLVGRECKEGGHQA